MQTLFPAVNGVAGRRWIDDGPVVTSAGISAGIDSRLHLVERPAGGEPALRAARQMDFDWRPGPWTRHRQGRRTTALSARAD